MLTLEEINARLEAIAKEIEEKGDTLTAEQLTALEKEVSDLKAKKDELSSKEDRNEDTNSSTPTATTQEQRQKLLSNIAHRSGGVNVLRNFSPKEEKDEDKFSTTQYRNAFKSYVTRGAKIPIEFRAHEITNTTDVGAVIPTQVLNQITEKLEKVGSIIKLVTKTNYKGGVQIPTSSVKPVATWVGEGKGSDKQKADIKKENMITFTYHKLRCAVAVSLEVDTMALSAFEANFVDKVVNAMTKAQEEAVINGDGVGKPLGILAEKVATDKKITISSLAYKDLIDAEGALPQEYESEAIWCMSKKTFMQYFGLTDSNGQPIGRVNYGIEGKPERFLLGRRVECCDYVPSYASNLTAGKTFAFLFNFNDYVINTNLQMGIKRYEDNDTDDIVTKAITIVDGKVVDNGSLVMLTKKA